MRSARLAMVLDVACVLVFVIIGRDSHAQGESLRGIASTAWPFLAGLAFGWLAGRTWRQPFRLSPAGVSAWLGAVVLGMLFRVPVRAGHRGRVHRRRAGVPRPVPARLAPARPAGLRSEQASALTEVRSRPMS